MFEGFLQALSLIREPVSREKRDLLAARWQELSPELRTEWQVVGRQLVHCGYTMGPSYCSFGCTHCYLPRNANRVPLPSLETMKTQIDANRRLLGPDSGLQITGGDVVDAYCRADRRHELLEIVRYAVDMELVPMLMTHGQRLLEEPELLVRLVAEAGLRKIALHIDMTQAGRPGFPIRSLSRESDLHPVRDAFVDLIHEVRERTGIRFHAAHTVTVTERNFESLADIFEWFVGDPRRIAAFGMISLQPEADVGRTRFSNSPVTPDAVWQRLCEALGVELDRDNLWFGHPDCSSMTTALLRPRDRRAINLMPSDESGRRFVGALLASFGGVGSRGHDHRRANLQRLGVLLRRPAFLWRALCFVVQLARRERLGLGFVMDLLRGRARPLNIVLHNFMSSDELARGGEIVEKRLAACSFRGAVERDGEWVAVPMCSMNIEEREDLYQQQIDTATLPEQNRDREKALPVLA